MADEKKAGIPVLEPTSARISAHIRQDLADAWISEFLMIKLTGSSRAVCTLNALRNPASVRPRHAPQIGSAKLESESMEGSNDQPAGILRWKDGKNLSAQMCMHMYPKMSQTSQPTRNVTRPAVF